MKSEVTELIKKVKAAKKASRTLARLSTQPKNKALHSIADALIARQDEIIKANKLDYNDAKKSGMDSAMLDRLMLNPDRIKGMANDVRTVASLPDPVGESIEARTLPNGLRLEKRRVPLGVICTIYESRPNVTSDISSLCLKSGNAVVLRGGKESLRSNSALAKVIRDAARAGGVPADAIQFIESTDRTLVYELLKLKGYIDLVIPRGGEGLVSMVNENSAIPVLASGVGICHLYVDPTADLKKAAAIAYNAKVQRPTVCNALDCVLVHSSVAKKFLPMMAKELAKAKVEMHCDKRAYEILAGFKSKKAVASDWGKEFLALVLAVRVVDSLDEAIDFINEHNSQHSDAIATEDYSNAMRFVDEVDSACVYVNASTRFTDGGQFGLGAEVGISTQKLHARGPMGVRELTTYKWIILGSGQVRG
jgi:glutamate-5-semialdehyde dehydrogenase